MRQMTAIQAGERLSEDSNKTGESTILKNLVSQWAENTGLSPSQDRELSSASFLHDQRSALSCLGLAVIPRCL